MSQHTPIRNPKTDHLLTPENCVCVFIDYQPEQFRGVNSKSSQELMMNIVTLAKTCSDFSIPVILSTVGVELGVNQGTVKEIKELFPHEPEIDRTSLNAWEDQEFLNAVKNTGRKKIIMSGLWTEVCVAFPTLDALKDGYEVYPVIDAIGGVSKESHQVAVERMILAGARPITSLALACEIQRDWARSHGDKLRAIYNWHFRQRGLLLKLSA